MLLVTSIIWGDKEGHTLHAVLTIKFLSSVGIESSKEWITCHLSDSSFTTTCKYNDKAIPTESNPGPTFAVLAGTRILNGITT